MRVLSLVLGVLFSVMLSSPAIAQEPERPEDLKKELEAPEAITPEEGATLKTGVDDSGYGTNRLVASEHFPEKESSGQVDRRQAIDAMADHAILLPNAYTPEQWTISYTNTNFFLNSLSFSPTDKVEATLSLVIPSEITDLRVGGATKIALVEDFSYLISIQPFVEYHQGIETLDVRNLGFGAGFLADFYLSDRFILSAGAHGFLNAVHWTDELNYDTCQSRQDYLDGNCIDTTPNSNIGPKGGHWLAVHSSMIYYMYDSLSLRLEVITGFSSGSFLGTEYLDGTDGFTEKSERFANPEFSLGIPAGSLITLGAGTAWSYRNFGIQLSAYVNRGRRVDDIEEMWLLYPVLSLSAAY